MLPTHECCGCEACISACAFDAISLKPDDAGFFYPWIDGQKCTNCQACEKKCPVLLDWDNRGYEERQFIAGYVTEGLKDVSSGGAASAMAESVIQAGGIVYGVSWTDDYKSAEYIRIDTVTGIQKIRGTKYVQASKRNGKIYKAALVDLMEGKEVLFFGLPCEIAGLKSFLGKDYDELITVQLICQGVTSQSFLRQFVEEIEKRKKSKTVNLTHRYKKNGVVPKYFRIQLANGAVFEELLLVTEFGYAFVNCDRESCYDCHFKGNQRVADVTIGDFWGISENDPYYKNEGVSLIITHTDKGDKLVRRLPESFETFTADLEKACNGNPSMYKSRVMPETRNVLIRNVKELGLIKGTKKTYTKKDLAKIAFYKCLPLSMQRKLLSVLK